MRSPGTSVQRAARVGVIHRGADRRRIEIAPAQRELTGAGGDDVALRARDGLRGLVHVLRAGPSSNRSPCVSSLQATNASKPHRAMVLVFIVATVNATAVPGRTSRCLAGEHLVAWEEPSALRTAGCSGSVASWSVDADRRLPDDRALIATGMPCLPGTVRAVSCST